MLNALKFQFKEGGLLYEIRRYTYKVIFAIRGVLYRKCTAED